MRYKTLEIVQLLVIVTGLSPIFQSEKNPYHIDKVES